MSDIQILGVVGGGILVLAGVVLARTARRKAGFTRRVGETPFSPIGGMGKGMVKIRGRIQPEGGEKGGLRSPLTNAPCVYYSFEVEEKRTRYGGKGRTSSYWATVIDDVRYVPAVVTDDTGQCRINLGRATIDLVQDRNFRSGFLNDAPPDVERMLQERYGRSSVGLVFNRSMRYEETVLEVGDEVRVLGVGRGIGGKVPDIVAGEVPLVVSDKGETALSDHFRSQTVLYAVFGVLCLLAGAALAGVLLLR